MDPVMLPKRLALLAERLLANERCRTTVTERSYLSQLLRLAGCPTAEAFRRNFHHVVHDDTLPYHRALLVRRDDYRRRAERAERQLGQNAA